LDISVEKLLASRDSLQLTTKGRRTGKPHSVIVSFVYEDGYVYLLAEVPRDWHKNIKKNSDVTLGIGDKVIRGVAEPILDEEKALADIKSKFKNKYSSSYYVQWYEPWRGARCELSCPLSLSALWALLRKSKCNRTTASKFKIPLTITDLWCSL